MSSQHRLGSNDSMVLGLVTLLSATVALSDAEVGVWWIAFVAAWTALHMPFWLLRTLRKTHK